ncbi:hypothetical protein CFE70_010213 [Pyrenophora teres f. teres 0-1]|uniref:WW domain-containing protein n=1 Tax=Pyrenophora teres f. teres (strain 0-1) TaxID=861557 RepID=E3RK24_PYRTT|nr:hypothetical protein PTT_08556 [Pyrenophora teres f. teres 0-1]
MDFLKKKMKELLDDDDKKPADTQPSTPQAAPQQSYGGAPGGAAPCDRGLSDGYYGQSAPGGPPQGQQPSPGQGYPPQDAPQGGYGFPPQGQGYPPQGQGYPPQGYPQPQPYGQAPTPVGPPAPYGAPPPMPPGWTQQWDQNSQRWFYIEQATGRTQWDPPSNLPPGPYAPPAVGAPYVAPAGHDERALFGDTGGHQGHDYTATGKATNEAEKKKGFSTGMMAAAGIGGIAAGAFIGHQLADDSSDDEKHQSHAPPPAAAAAAAPAAAAYGTDPTYGADPAYGAPPPSDNPYDNHPAFEEPPPVPTHDEDGSSISSSDRESLEEKRQELIEAQQEYQEALEEEYED